MKLSESQIKQYLSSSNSQIKSETILKAQAFLSEYELSLERFLGAGAFGVVLKAQDHSNNREVAVKIIVCQDGNMVKESLSEFQKMKLIKSKFVLMSYEIYYDDSNETIYMVTEYGPNGDLYNFIKANEPLPKSKIIEIFNGILDGLQAIHLKNIIHADLKPQNIIQFENNSPKICDFGLSKKVINKSFTSLKGLTPFYTSKEQIQGQIYKESDIYSAGAILCSLCGLNFEDDIMLSFAMKEGNFPDISNHKNHDLLTIAFQMMNSNYQKRISIEQAKQMLSQIEGNTSQTQQITNIQKESDTNKQIKNGYWVFLFNSGARYEGEFKNNQMNGKGKYYFANGNTIDGQWLDNCLGFGIFHSQNPKERYEGEFKNGQKNGKGKYYYANGNIYDGQWIENKKHGFGIFHYQNTKERYEGELKNDQMNGKGKYYFANGNIYDGQWLDSKQHGFGISHFQNAKERYEGEFKNGKMNGKGKYYYANGNIYDGQWLDSKKDGFGIFHFQNGKERYEGEFKNDQKNGEGKYYHANGNTYDGQWLDNKKHGFGIQHFLNAKERYEGEFKNDQMNGKGKYYYANGDVYDGLWLDDIKQS